MSDPLNPDQFLYHGTAKDIVGDKILPAVEHGQGSYWEDTGSGRGEPAEEYAWAHPSEDSVWEFAADRASNGVYPAFSGARASVYAVRPNEHQSPGRDPSIPGEVKAPYFDIEERIDIMPGRQGTFPEVNWNKYVDEYKRPYREDANHPSNLSVQFGHKQGAKVDHLSPEDADRAMSRNLVEQARSEDDERHIQSLDDRNIKPQYREKDPELPLRIRR